MIRAKIEADTLERFYQRIVAAQVAAHGEHYCAHHDVIREHAARNLVYAELGVNQGATLACAILAGYGEVWGVDVDAAPFLEFEALFRPKGVKTGEWPGISVWERDSREPFARPVDFLLIDSLHRAEHMREELAVHAPNVTRFILAHDTTAHHKLHAELERLEGWRVAEHDTRGFGYTLMERL